MYKLHHGDCIPYMKTLPNGFIDLTVTSPPYDNLRTYGKDFDANAFDWHSIIKELYRITDVGGVVVWVVADATIKGSETGTSFRQALWAMECGFRLHDTMIYNKLGNGAPQRRPYRRYSPSFEYMFVFSKGEPRIKNMILTYGKEKGIRKKSKRGKNGKTVIGYYNAGSGSPKQNVWRVAADHMTKKTTQDGYVHPAIFPASLARDHIVSWSNEGDKVFDPMMGSGTVGVEAVKLKRPFYGCELDKGYFVDAEIRIKNLANEFTPTAKEKASGQMALWGGVIR